MKFATYSLAAICLLSAQGALAQKRPKDVLHGTHTVKGQFVRFEFGDYIHAVVKDTKGHEQIFYFNDPGIDYYLATHPRKLGVFTIQVLDSYFPEAGGMERIEQISKVKIGDSDSKSWYKAQLRHSTTEKLAAKYEPLVDKMTKKYN